MKHEVLQIVCLVISGSRFTYNPTQDYKPREDRFLQKFISSRNGPVKNKAGMRKHSSTLTLQLLKGVVHIRGRAEGVLRVRGLSEATTVVGSDCASSEISVDIC